MLRRLPERAALVVALTLGVACSCGSQRISSGGAIPTGVKNDTQPDGHTLDFGKVMLDRKRTVSFLLKNDGRSALVVTGIRSKQTTGDIAAFDVALASSVTIQPGLVGEVPMGFTPTELRDYAADVSLVTNSKTQLFDVHLQGTGVDHTFEIDPTTLDFGHVVVGNSNALTVKVKNLALYGEKLTVTPLTSSDPTALGQYAMAQPPAALPAATSTAPGEADVTVTFAPKFSSGGQPFAASFSIAPCDGCTPVDIPVTGVGVDSGVDVTPNPVDFGFVNPNTTVKKDVTITNASSNVFDLEQISLDALTQDDVAAFRLDPATVPALPKTLNPGDTVVVSLTFTPSRVKQYGWDPGSSSFTTRIIVKTTDSKAPEIDVGVKGFGGGPNISVIPLELDFGSVSTTAPLTKQLLVTNTGYDDPTTNLDDLQVSSIAVTVEGQVYTTDFTTPFTLPVGQSQIVNVTFAPTAQQDYNDGELHIQSNDVDTPDLLVKLTGNGIALPPCDFEILPPSKTLDFGVIDSGRTLDLTFAVHNVGTTQCMVNAIHVDPGSPSVFTVTQPNDPSIATCQPGVPGCYMLDPGQQLVVPVTFAPVQYASYSGQVDFYISTPGQTDQSVSLTGKAAQGCLLIAPQDLDFGVVGVNCNSVIRDVSVYNTCSSAVTLSNIAINTNGSVGREFSITSAPVLPVTLPDASGNASTKFSVRFKPVAEGDDSAIVDITSSEFPNPYVVSLTGHGSTTAIQTDHFTQANEPKVDILFIVDNSGSMCDKQDSLANNLDSFLSFATAQQIDYHIGVVKLDWEDSSVTTFGRIDGSPQIVTPNDANAQTDLAANIRVGCNGSGCAESGFEAAYRALTNPLATDPSANAGFLRSGALLSVIALSDEEEQSPAANACGDLNPPISHPTDVNFFVNAFLSIKGFRHQNMFSYNVIVGDPSSAAGGTGAGGCSGCGTAAAGDRYVQLASRTGGIFHSICDCNFHTALEQLGQTAFGYKSEFFLQNLPDTSKPITVKIDGVDQPPQQNGSTVWTYSSARNSIQFAPLAIPEPGKSIDVSYYVMCL